jgi:hypothetical protein
VLVTTGCDLATSDYVISPCFIKVRHSENRAYRTQMDTPLRDMTQAKAVSQALYRPFGENWAQVLADGYGV